jgi:recombination associated protein RdgC
MTKMAKEADPNAQAFLGREFLTWLWFRCETDGGAFDLPDGEVGVVFNDYVALVSEGEEREENICKKGSAHRSQEARTALSVGKVVSAAKLEIARGERAFAATIAGDTLDVRSAKYPDPEAEDPEERALERLEAMEELAEIIDGLYGLFLAVRLAPVWDAKEVPAVTKWIRKRARAEAAG